MGSGLVPQSIFAQSKAEEINLPEYVISGVDRVARISGHRIPSMASVSLSQPAFTTTGRPDFSFETATNPLSMSPNLRSRALPELEASTWVGGFKQIGISALAHDGTYSIPYHIEVHAENMPQRLDRGFQNAQSIKAMTNLTPFDMIKLTPEIGWQRGSYKLAPPDTGKSPVWNGFDLGIGVQPIESVHGIYSGRLDLGTWSLSGDNSRDSKDIDVHLSRIDMSNKYLFRTDLQYFAQVTDRFDDRLFFLTHRMRLPQSNDVSMVAGLNFFNPSVIKPNVTITAHAPKDIAVSIYYDPQPVIYRYSDIYAKSPYLKLANGFAGIEDYRTGVSLTQSFATRARFTLSNQWRRLRKPQAYSYRYHSNDPDSWVMSLPLVDETSQKLTGWYYINGSHVLELYIEHFQNNYPEPYSDDWSKIKNFPEWDGGLVLRSNIFELAIENELCYGGSSEVAELIGSLNVNNLGGPTIFATRPAYLEWNIAVAGDYNHKIGWRGELNNILNQHYFTIPDYDEPPFNIQLGLTYKFYQDKF